MQWMAWLWLALLILFIYVEVSTVTMVSLWFAAGALTALLASLFQAELWLQVVLFVVVRGIVRHPLGLFSAYLVISGGLGNIIDRARLGYVVDMLHLEFWPSYPTFNVADMCIVCGVIVGMLYYLFLYDKYDAVKKEEEANDGEPDAADE